MKIYVSDLGDEKLKVESQFGPIELYKTAKVVEKTGDDEEKVSPFDLAALRKYELERLKYYYAIITFDSPQIAS